ncbi:MAG: Crp/Fnr family transcriptional regulator [Oscillospiraceae bacterium]|nr:Crp/Fnr family transcriptional regulator [Oscillospiraceae bacterium]
MRAEMVFTPEDFESIMTAELFRGISPAGLQALLKDSGCETRSYGRDEEVYSRTRFRRSLGVVLEGSLLVTKENAEGKDMIMSTLHRGDMFGAAALFNSEREFQTKISSREPCRIVFFSQELIVRLMERVPGIAENYIRYLSQRILFLNRKLYFLTAGTAEQRLASFMMNNLSEYDDARLPMSMTALASALNISRASLYRALDAVVDSGAVVKNGKLFRIADSEKLCGFIV